MITNDTFAIAIPTLNRHDLLNPTLQKYVSELFPTTWICVCDNGNQPLYKHENITILKQYDNLFVSGSWNELCKTVFLNYDYCLMLNDDICINAAEKEITQLIEEESSVDFFNSYFQWSSFLLPKKTYQQIGEFDEELRIWFNDNDYEYRMKKERLSIMTSSILNPVEFVKDGTVSENPTLHRQFEIDRQAYIRKHGGGPGNEMY